MSEDTSSLNNNKVLNESSKSALEDFYRATQATLEKGLETCFKNLNNSLYTTINSTFSTFATDYEKRLEQNRETHEKAVEALNTTLKAQKVNLNKNDINKKDQENEMIKTFEKIQNLKLKAKIFHRLNKYAYEHKKKNIKDDIITQFLQNKKKNLIFNSWRNVTNSMQKSKIKLKYGEANKEKFNEMNNNFNDEMSKLKLVLENLQLDIKKEIEERRALSKLYDLSLKKGVEEFLRETNYIIDFNSSNVNTPHERSFNESYEKERREEMK
jgi:hypothetical protein